MISLWVVTGAVAIGDHWAIAAEHLHGCGHLVRWEEEGAEAEGKKGEEKEEEIRESVKNVGNYDKCGPCIHKDLISMPDLATISSHTQSFHLACGHCP